MRDSRKLRRMLSVGIAAGLIGILGEFYIRPVVTKEVRR